MQEQTGSHKNFSIAERLKALREEREALRWEGTFQEYFELVTREPRLAQLSHARINEMIHQAGVAKINEGARDELLTYNFFSDEIYGIEESIAQIVEYFKSAAQRLEVRKRILLLMGPVGGGKSTIVSLIKRGLENYTRSESGAVYGIKNCPMHEDPLHLIPHELRPEIERTYGLYIEGDLCPQCSYDLIHNTGGRSEDVMVERITFSEKDRIGIGTFSPSDPKCVTGDTILLTNQGMRRFDELQTEINAADDKFEPFAVGVAGIDGAEFTSHFYNGGVRETRRVKTRLGYEIEGSLVHPLLVMRGGQAEWIKLRDLRVGDSVALQRGQNLFGSNTKLLPFIDTGSASRGQSRALTLPNELNADLARLLGYIIAEGSLTDTGLWITNGSERVITDVANICERIFNVAPKIYRKKGTHAVSISISSVKLVRWLEQICVVKRGAANKTIPAIIMSAPREIFLSFIEGWAWGDGTISARKSLGSNRFKIATASIETARQLQIALLNLGIVAARYKERIKDKFIAYSVVVTGDAVVDLLELIPSLREKCTDAPESLAAKRGRTNFDVVPQTQTTTAALLGEIKQTDKALFRFNRYATTAAWGRDATRAVLTRLVAHGETVLGADTALLEPLREQLKQNLLWLEVQEITDGEAQVFDLTVPGTHSFCANGFVNHNSQDITELTGSIDLSTIGDVGVESDPRAYRFDGELNIANRGVMEFIEMLKCLCVNTYVATERGFVQIGEIVPPTPPHHQDFQFELKMQTRGGAQLTSHIIYNGKGETKKLKTRKGYRLEGSLEHRILVVSNGDFVWRKLKDVQKGDKICINRKGYFGVTEAPLLDEFQPQRKGRPELQLPATMNEDLARLLGYFVAEGWFLKDANGNDAGVGIANQDAEFIADLTEIAASLNLNLRAGGRCRWHLNNCGLADLLHNFGFDGRTAFEKHIPQIVRRSPKNIIAAFLRAYFDGDGTVTTYIACTTASEKLAEQIHQLLLNFGIVSKLQTVFNKKYERDYFQIQIDSDNAAIFNREIGFGLTRKREAAERLAAEFRSRHRDGLPEFEIHWQNLQTQLQVLAREKQLEAAVDYRARIGARQLIGDANYEQLWRFANSQIAPSYNAVQSVVVESLENLLPIPNQLQTAIGEQFFIDEIAEISDGYDDLWDFCVPANHTYIGNGFVNHNCDEKFLYSLLTLSQEQNIKTGRFAMIYADEVIMSHTNESEYANFVGNRKNEALQDRIILVKVPYNLRVTQEERIYQKLLGQSEVLRNVHIAPYTLKVAAMFAVLTRLEDPKKASVDLVKKMKLYDGETVEGFKSKDVRELRDDTVREGMDGISPRYIINRLSGALVKDGVKFITPIDALRAIKDGFDQHTGISAEQKERYLNLISAARKEYDEIAKTEVQRAFVYSFEEMARTMCNNYLDNVEAYCNKDRLRDKITDEEIEPDETLMRSIEQQIGISENAKNTFRQEILIRISSYARKGIPFEYKSHERLKEAIEKKIFADLKDVVKITTSVKTPDPDQLRRINEVVNRLVESHGYTPESANELLTYVGSLMAR